MREVAEDGVPKSALELAIKGKAKVGGEVRGGRRCWGGGDRVVGLGCGCTKHPMTRASNERGRWRAASVGEKEVG